MLKTVKIVHLAPGESLFNGSLYLLNGNTRPVCHFQVCAGISVEKRGFPAIWISDKADSQIFTHRNLPH